MPSLLSFLSKLSKWLISKGGKEIERGNAKKYDAMSKKETPEKETEEKIEKETKGQAEKTISKKKKRSSKSSKKNEELEKLQTEKEELKDKYLRLVAEFDNYKKRTMKERLELVNTAASKTIKSLIPAVDDFDRAVKAAEDDSNAEPLSEGVLMVHKRIKSILEQQGLKEMETNGQDFNADFHEALTEVPGSEDMKGKVIDTIEKGYTLNDRIIRYARVVVGK